MHTFEHYVASPSCIYNGIHSYEFGVVNTRISIPSSAVVFSGVASFLAPAASNDSDFP